MLANSIRPAQSVPVTIAPDPRLQLDDGPGVATARWLDSATLELEADDRRQPLVVVEVGTAWQWSEFGGNRFPSFTAH